MRLFSVLAAATFLSACSAAPEPRNTHVLHEKREANPHQWTRHGRASPHESLPIRIGLRQQNLHHADKYVYDVADPESPNFGKHWTAEQVANTFASHPKTKDVVSSWLAESGIDRSRVSYSKGRNWVQFDGTVREAEDILNTKYYYYKHKESGGYRLACDSYSLPKHVQSHVDFAMPTIHLDGLKPMANMQPASYYYGNGATMDSYPCKKLATIECLRRLYNFGPGNTSTKGNEMGILEMKDHLRMRDLPIFFKNFTNPRIPAGTRPDFISIDGGKRANENNTTSPLLSIEGAESALDFQTSYPIIYPQNLRLYQLEQESFNPFLDAIDESYCTYEGGDDTELDSVHSETRQCGGVPKSNVLSVSYSLQEAGLPPRYQHRQCHEWMKLGLQGVSVIFSSGDNGVAGSSNGSSMCLKADSDKYDVNGTRYAPTFPSTCPYITSVGATELIGNNTNSGERAVSMKGSNYYSSGGFSNTFTLPKYQAAAVTNYTKKYAPNYGPKAYNSTGKARGFPDVSALGSNLVGVFEGQTGSAGGTSASAPIVASLVTLLNEARLAIGKGPIGFLNPTFYRNPHAFNDITIGSNPGCKSGGFNATPGWDPVTGLGTPRYKALEKVFLALP